MTDDEHARVILEARAEWERDPLNRYLQSLPEPARREADETIHKRETLMRHLQGAMGATLDHNERLEHAAWVKANIVEVTYRWSILMREVERFLIYDMRVSIVVKGGPYRE